MNISLIYNSAAVIPGGVYTGSAAGIQPLALIVINSVHIESAGAVMYRFHTAVALCHAAHYTDH